MKKIIPEETPNSQMHKLLLGAVGPRPIAFASTMNADGIPNLSPFSFFNVFGVNPTTLIFSPSRRNRDNTVKNTYENVKVVPEVVINMVTHEMVNQVSLASTEYPKGVDEFMKAGFTKVSSELVKPFRVKESPVHLECKVRQVIETGEGGGAANLIICEVLLMHVSEAILDENGLIDPFKIRLVARMGGDWYCKAFGDALFRVEKPLDRLGIGIDSLPQKIRYNKNLSGNELGRLGNLEHLPSQDELDTFRQTPPVMEILRQPDDREVKLVYTAKKLLEEGKSTEALKYLMLL